MTAASASTPALERRRESRVAAQFPMVVRGIDSMGYSFEEHTSSQNLCRGGAAFSLHSPLVLGDELEIEIPGLPTMASEDAEFWMPCRIVHLMVGTERRELIVGIEFIGPFFDPVFVPDATS